MSNQTADLLASLLQEALDDWVMVGEGASHEDVAAVSDFERRARGAIATYDAATPAESDRLEARIAELERERDHLASRYDAVCRAESEHCKDCCCARSWAALGISEYTGKSIPEHIDELRRDAARYRWLWGHYKVRYVEPWSGYSREYASRLQIDAAIDAAMAKEPRL